MRIFLVRSRLPIATIEDCAYCIFFLVFWRRDVEQRQRTDLKKNFITSETYQDVLCLCQSLIVAVTWYREKFPCIVFDPSR